MDHDLHNNAGYHISLIRHHGYYSIFFVAQFDMTTI